MASTPPQSPSRSPSPSQDIAAAMGFASFGTKPNPPKKKRKLAGIDPNSEGSGSNNTPLGVRSRKLGNSALDEESDRGGRCQRYWQGLEQRQSVVKEMDGEWRAGNGLTASSLPNISAPDETSRTVPANGRSQAQSMATSMESYDLHVKNEEEENLLEEARQRGLRKLEETGQGPKMQEGRRGNGEWDWQVLRRGVRDEGTDMAFYDGSFVEDPWRQLLLAKGDGAS